MSSFLNRHTRAPKGPTARRLKVIFLLVLFLAGSAWPQQTGDLVLLEAEKVTHDGPVTIARGNVTADLGGVKVDCQYLEFDSTTGKVIAREECIFYWGDNYATGREIVYDLNRNEAVMTRAAGQGTNLVHQNQQVESPLFFWADTLRWTPTKVVLENALVTTCDLNPTDYHYVIESEKIDLFPRDKLVATNTTVTLDQNRLYTVPTLIFPLNEDANRQRQGYFPSVGYNNLDGGFLRNAFSYYLDRNNYGTANIDLYQRSGVGTGLEHFFSLGDRGSGDIYFYRQEGQQSSRNRFELRSNLNYHIDEYTRLGLAYNANQFELPGVVSPLNVSSAVNLSRYAPGSALQVSANLARSGDNTNTSYRFFYDVELGERWSALLTADLSRASTRVTQTSRYHYLGSLRHRGELFDGDLSYERSGGQNTYFLNREPELRLRSHVLEVGPVPITMAASFGVLDESPSNFRTERYMFDLTVPDQIVETGVGDFHLGAGMRQQMYGSGQQQYVLGGRAGWLHNLGDHFVTRLDYNWQRPEGFTPFQHDLAFSYETVTGGIELYDTDLWTISASGGIDLRHEIGQDIITRLDVRPSDGWRLTAAANLDPQTGVWRSVDSGLSMPLTNDLSLTHWSVYDLVNGRLTYQNFAVNYEDHDWIGSLAYRGVQNEIFFQLSLKAFPLRPLKVGPDSALPILPQNLSNAFVR